MLGDIVIDDVHMDEDAKFILSGLDTLDQKKDFYLVYFRMRSTIQARVYVEAFIENIHNEFVGEQRVDVDDDEIQDEHMEVEKSIDEKSKIDENNGKGLVLGRKKKNIVRKKKGGVPCDGHCNRVFKSRWNMKRHLDAQKLIKCEHCTTFYLRGTRNLRTHMKKKHEKYLETLKCETCDGEFAGEKSLSMHMKKHDPSIADGKFQCDVCMI